MATEEIAGRSLRQRSSLGQHDHPCGAMVPFPDFPLVAKGPRMRGSKDKDHPRQNGDYVLSSSGRSIVPTPFAPATPGRIKSLVNIDLSFRAIPDSPRSLAENWRTGAGRFFDRKCKRAKWISDCGLEFRRTGAAGWLRALRDFSRIRRAKQICPNRSEPRPESLLSAVYRTI